MNKIDIVAIPLGYFQNNENVILPVEIVNNENVLPYCKIPYSNGYNLIKLITTLEQAQNIIDTLPKSVYINQSFEIVNKILPYGRKIIARD